MVCEQFFLQGNLFYLSEAALVILIWGPFALKHFTVYLAFCVGSAIKILQILFSKQTCRIFVSCKLAKPLMTHVLDRWCSDGVRFVCRGTSQKAILAKKTPYDTSKHPMSLGTRRIGEAKNPGPETRVNFASINPTSLVNKHDEFAILSQTHNVHIVAAAETTATIETQQAFSKVVQKHGYGTVWSPPVMPQKIRIDGLPSKRGRVGGVALFSKFPCRRSWDQFQKPWDTSTRLVHSLVQLGHLWIQVFVIYGLAMPNKGAKDFTDDLFHQACEQSKNLPYPAIFIGDFNHDVHSLQDFHELYEHGYRSLQQIYRQKYMCKMPPTCKEATTPDTAIIPPELISFVDSITVVKTGLFDTHDPVIFQLVLPEEQLFRYKIPIPHSWIEFPITKQDLEEKSKEVNCDQISTLEEWGTVTENVVDAVLVADHLADPSMTVIKSLPKRCKGRCQPISLKKFPIPAPVKRAWNGHYNPSHETHTIHYKRTVRQFRRITSLKKRVQMLDQYSEIWHRTIQDILTEWNVITTAVFRGTPFWMWIANIPELNPVPWDFPTFQWLHYLEQFVKIEVEQLAVEDKKIQNMIHKFRQQTDCQDANKREAFAKVKAKQFQPFNRTKTEICEEGYITATSENSVFEIFVSYPMDYHVFMPIQVDNQLAKLVGKSEIALNVEFSEPYQPTKEVVEVVQNIEHCDLTIIFEQLWQYWNQYWNRDEDAQAYDEHADSYLHSLKNMLPELPEFPQFQSNDLALWKEAIKKSKIRSSPGCDGVTFAEMKVMPDILIQKLADIIEMQGFPETLMCARTIPLPKVDHLPTPGDSRPITILPTTYRLWARVVTNKVLCYLGSILPPQITGMLPGRGAATASYDFQVLLEISKRHVQAVTGITLDLKKCFNLINRKKVKQLMLAWGIPDCLINKWFESLRHLRRFWDIQNNCSDMRSATTGCPEGDSWSVVAMLTIAATWAHVLCMIHPTIDATAYADNWTWWSKDINQHQACIEHTKEFTKWLGLQIDWKKTWRWSTNTEQVKILDNILKPHTQGVCVEAPPSAWDLGAPIGYRGFTKLGKTQERLKKGHERLIRIKNAPWDITTKAHIIFASVYTLAFYACESVVIGQSHLESFRSAVAEAILGKECRSASPVLALHCADLSLIDPYLYVILRALKEARRFLLRCDESQKQAFLFAASRPQKVVGLCHGPASALREYLLRVGWYLDKEGNIGVADHLSFNILQVSYKRLKNFMMLEWQKHLVKIHTQRFHLYSFPPISRNDTIKVLSPKQRLDLLKEICGAFQTRYQQSQWDKTITDKCEFCGEAIDTKKHRLVECPVFHEQRKEHHTILQTLNETDDDVLTELPVIYESPLNELKLAIQFAEPEAQISSDIITTLQNNCPTPHLYSDGSCQFQHSPTTRFAAYSLIADLCTTDEMREQQALQYLVTGKIPETLVRIGSARCGGEQHIGRAELWPITIAFENFNDFVLHTDSAYCVDTVNKIQNCKNIVEMQDHSDFDLVQRIFHQPHNNQRVIKIAAHKDPKDIKNLVERYHCLGNMLANDTAIDMCLKGDPIITAQYKESHTQLEQQMQQLKQVFDLHLMLQKERARVSSQPAKQTDQVAEDDNQLSNLEVAIQQWCPQGPRWEPPEVVTRQWLEFSAWGQQVSFVILQWLLDLHWGINDNGPDGEMVGLSWTEVAISISLKLGAWLPFRRFSANNEEMLIHPQNTAMTASWGVTLSEMSQNAYLLVTQVQTLVPQQLRPKEVTIGKVKSLSAQGYHAWTTGFRRRPKFPFQKEVFDILQEYFKSDSKTLHGLPDLCFLTEYQSWQQDDQSNSNWKKRYMTACSKAKIVAKLRKTS